MNPEEREQTWADMAFGVNRITGDITWTAKNPNRPWIRSLSEKTKQRRVPFWVVCNVRLECSEVYYSVE